MNISEAERRWFAVDPARRYCGAARRLHGIAPASGRGCAKSPERS